MSKKPPSFVEMYAPRCEPLEQLRAMAADKDKARGFQDFLGHFKGTVPTPARPRTLLDMYLRGDARQIFQDAQVRADHYDARQHEVLTSLMGQGSVDTPVTDQEKDELFLAWLAASEAKKATQERNTKLTNARHDDIILEDGRTLGEAESDSKHRASFEAQDHDDKIII